MGSSSSKTEENDKSKCRLNKEEIQILRKEFQHFIDKNDVIIENELKGHLNKLCSDYLVERLCNCLVEISKTQLSTNRKNSIPITFYGLLTFASEILRGNQSDQCRIFTKLATDSVNPTAENISKITSNIICSYLKAIQNTRHVSSWQSGVYESDCNKLGRFLLLDLFHKNILLKDCFDITAVPDQSISVEEIQKWYCQSPLVANMITKIFSVLFKLENESSMSDTSKELLPMCYGVKWHSVKSVLSLADITLVNNFIPGHLRNRWRFLFSSRQFGENFSQLIKRVVNRGPNVIIVKEKGGAVFGGYASESWKIQPQFQGNHDCFLFTLHPNIGIFSATGYNDHFMYLNLNQQTMPNGLGMGGQLGYFGLWLESEYGKGSCSKTCTTYHSPQLCSSGDFIIDTIEIWGVGPEPILQEEGTRSALDNVDPEIKAILEMVNKAPISEAIRDADKKVQHEDENLDLKR